MRWVFLYTFQILVAFMFFITNYIVALWQGHELLSFRDWRDKAIFTSNDADYPAFFDRLIYVAKNYPLTAAILVISFFYMVIMMILFYKKWTLMKASNNEHMD
ncbi:hypothetical protein J2T17_007461 [Paenibacillus mucilaginosus]|uniref:DUF4306 domain-containing protein n=1 Tax=Paenibacillus mucilaginosus TaxID=61624 RepID=UPI003D1AEFF7